MMKSFWAYLGGTIVAPGRTFRALQSDPKMVSKGFKAILLIGGLYIITVALLAAGGALITAPAALAISAENYYFFEVFFALPVCVAGWILAAAAARLMSRWGRGSGTFEGTLAALGFAVTVPMFLTWATETVFAVLLVLGMSQEEFMDLIAQSKFLQVFGWAYQIAAISWMLLLTMIAVGVSQKLTWWRAVVVGLLTTIVFMAVMLVFIR